jgi:pimeloyl-ACP methyl ester carboxylesterase
MLWPLYDAIRCPTLVVRGAQSDLLSAVTAAEMGRRGPQASTVEIPGVGHAPVFADEFQIGVVREFLVG